MTENTNTKDIIDAIDEAILDPEPPAAVVVPNDLADSITVVEVKPKAPARKPAPRKAPAKKEVAKVDTVVEGELPLEKSKAEALDKKIVAATQRVTTAVDNFEERMTALTKLVDEAKAGQIHVGLGFASWTAYFDARVQMPVITSLTERKPVIALLHEAGMSQRDIAKQINVSVGTVNATVQELNASRPADAEKPAAKTVDKRGAVRDRTKAGQAGKKAAAQKKSNTGKANTRGPQITPRAVMLGDVANTLEKTGITYLPGEITNIRRIAKAAAKVIADFDLKAANNRTAKA